jgi:hypothetical protein
MPQLNCWSGSGFGRWIGKYPEHVQTVVSDTVEELQVLKKSILFQAK